MIKTTSFYLFMNLRRDTQEFYDNKAIVKVKSIILERDYEFEYKDVDEISDTFYVSASQLTFSFFLICLSSFTLTAFRNFNYAHPFVFHIEQIIYLCGILLLTAGFKKSWSFRISDLNDNVFAYIKQTRQNRDLIPHIIELIKTKSNEAQEVSITNLFPDEPAAFEITEYSILDFAKTTEKFYKDKIIGAQWGLFGETAYQIRYSHLNGKIIRGKSRGEMGWVPFVFILANAILAGLIFGFQVRFGTHTGLVFTYLTFIFLALFLILLLLSLIKHENVGLFSNAGSVVYWTSVSKKNKDKVEKIIEFIQSNIPNEEKNQSLEEYP